jgi:hypothetical protein
MIADTRRGVKRYAFRDGVPVYRPLGWTGTIPVTTHGTKAPLYAGITGAEGSDADDELLSFLIRKYGWANIGLRLPWDVIGIDVDAYDGRNGGRTLRRLSGILGPLPTTWRSTSRAPEDAVSGIYLFRAPRKPDWLWTGDLGVGSGIEIAQYHHRFATVAPSLHNVTRRPYMWRRGEREATAPRPEELPQLPLDWARYLLSSRKYRAGGTATPAEAAEWWSRVSGGPMCAGMERSARTEARKLREAAAGSGLHDALIVAVTHLCRNAAEGCTGLNRALNIAETEFSRARRSRDLRAEWQSAVGTAMANAAGGKQSARDSCREMAGLRPVRRRK